MAEHKDKKALRDRILNAFLGALGKGKTALAASSRAAFSPSTGYSMLKGLEAAEKVESPEAGLLAGIAAGLYGPEELRMKKALQESQIARSNQKPRVFTKVDSEGNLQIVMVDPTTGETVSQPLPGGLKFPHLPETVSVMTEKQAAKAGKVPFRTQIIPDPERKGTQEAVLVVAAAGKALKLVDPLFDKFAALPEVGARVAATKKGPLSMVARAKFPELIALQDNFIASTVFSIGGKQLTISEKEIVTDAFLPNFFDNAASRELKRKIVKDYLTGKIEIIAAARLLGPAGAKALKVLEVKFNPSEPGIGEREKFIRILIKDRGFTRQTASQAADDEGLE